MRHLFAVLAAVLLLVGCVHEGYRGAPATPIDVDQGHGTNITYPVSDLNDMG